MKQEDKIKCIVSDNGTIIPINTIAAISGKNCIHHIWTNRDQDHEGYRLSDEQYNVLIKELKILSNDPDEENEDEKVRNKLIEFFKGYYPDKEWWGNITQKDILTWFEKQGQHDKFINNIQIGDKVTRNQDGVLVNLSQLKRVAKPSEKPCESIGDTDTVDSNEDGLIAATISSKPAVYIPKFHVGDKLVSTKNPSLTYEVLEVGHINELGNPEYKVEIFTDGKVSNPHNIHYMECYKVDGWAKLIEQKPAKWSEKDEINLEKAIWYVENPAPMVVKDSMLVEWLKSLRERFTWKPSDEQLNSLYDVLNPCDGFNREVLESLYEQLKKLKG